MEHEIRKILDSKLKNNDKNITNIILSFLKFECPSCGNVEFTDNLPKCDNSDCAGVWYQIILLYLMI